MNGLCLVSAFSQDSLHVHQAAGIDCGHVLGSGHRDAVGLRGTHGHGDAFKFRGKRATETAAFVKAQHVHQLQPFDLAQKLQRLVAQAELAETMAGGVIGDRVRKGRADIGHTGHLHQEF